MLDFKKTKYREIIREFISEQPRKGRGLMKTMAEYLLLSPSQFSQILTEDRDFSEEQALSLGKFMGLRDLELEYFLTLVKIERASSQDLKNHYKQAAQKIRESSLDLKQRINQDRILTDAEKSVFYSSYIYSAIRLESSVGEGRSLGWLAEHFDLPLEKMADMVGFLVGCGLCNEKNGLYTPGTQHTHVDRNSPYLVRHHHNWRIKALEKSHRISDKELQFTGPVSVDAETFNEIRETLVKLISQSIEKVKAGERPEGAACLLMDWFWV